VLDVVLLGKDQLRVRLAGGFQQELRVIFARVLETGEGVHLVADIAVSRRKLIAEGPEDGEVDLVGSVRVGRVGSWPDVGRVVGQDVVHVMGLRFVGPDDASIEGHMVGHPGVVGNTFLQAEVLR
jgi:hypothetical protein